MDRNNSSFKLVFIKGRNWGNITISNHKILFTGEDKPWFYIPLESVSNVRQASNKNELALEFNIEDEREQDNFVLTEMRFYVPDIDKNDKFQEENSNGDEKDNHTKTTAEVLKDEIEKEGNLGSVGDSIAHVPQIQMITPRGKFDLYFLKSAIKILGSSHNYKIEHKNISKVFLLPKTDGHQHYLIVALISPISQGNTSYPFLIFQIKNGAKSTVDLNIPDNMKLDLPNPLTGTVIDNIARLFNIIVDIGIIIPSKNISFSKGPFLKCSYKANEGVLYPLEKSLLFVHKPAVCINLEDIRQVDFARILDTSLQQRTFDLNIVSKKGEIQFVGIGKVELEPIINYFSSKKIIVNNIDEKNNIVDIAPSVRIINK